METIVSLYRVLILFSAGTILLGISLNLKHLSKISAEIRMLLIMAFVNLVSMFLFLFKPKEVDNHTIMAFFESLIIVLNLIIGYYVYRLRRTPAISFEKMVKNLFLVTFLIEFVLLVLIFTFKAEKDFLDAATYGFIYIYIFILAFFILGTFYPGIMAANRIFIHGEQNDKVYWLLFINLLNNLIGFVFFTLKIPDYSTGLIANMLINLVFAYYFGFFMISHFFAFQKENSQQKNKDNLVFSWQTLQGMLQHWSEVKSYVGKFEESLVKKCDDLPLSDLEKTHYILKELRIKTKDIAAALSVTVRAVEMQRYRIGKKLNEIQKNKKG